MTDIDIRRHFMLRHFDEFKAVRYLMLIGYNYAAARDYLNMCSFIHLAA